MDGTLVVELMPELESLSYAFWKALMDRSLEPCDLMQAGVVKLLETSVPRDVKENRTERGWAMKLFLNTCRDIERRGLRYQKRFNRDVDEEVLELVPGPHSFANLLTRLAIEECLETLDGLDKQIVLELVEPSPEVAVAARTRMERSRWKRGTVNVTFEDIARGRKLPMNRVRTAVGRAREALLYGGFRPAGA